MELSLGPPSPQSWLAEMFETSGRSRSELARMIGRSREEVARWATGREQIPRIHLVEIASQIAPADLDYVLKLKDCEDSFDRVRRQAGIFSHVSGADTGEVVSRLVLAMDRAMQSVHVDRSAEALAWVRNLSAALFTLRTWSEFLERPDRRGLITTNNIGRHLQYPVNLLVGTLLEFGMTPGSMSISRDAGLVELRRLIAGTKETESVPLIRQHAIHLLARYGDEDDRHTVTSVLAGGVRSTDALSRKLGYCGLMMSEEGREAADEFVYFLSRDDELADTDLAFDATHYGDLPLAGDNTLARPGKTFTSLATNIAKHYENPERYGSLFDADAFRMLKIIDIAGLDSLGEDVPKMFATCIESDLIPVEGGSFSRLLRKRLTTVLSANTADPAERVDTAGATQTAYVSRRFAAFDAFLAYRTDDRPAVIRVGTELRRIGVTCWLDVWEMVPGELVQEAMERAIDNCRSMVVFLGGSGLGPWQRMEYRRAMSLFVEKDLPVIPVILAGAELPSSAPSFLREFHVVRADDVGSAAELARSIARGLRRAGPEG